MPVLDPSPPLLAAMLSRESTDPRFSVDSARSASNTVVQFGPTEAAFLARPDPRQDSRQDSRPDFPRKDFRPDSRRPTSWDRRPDSQDRPRPDRPISASGILRMDDDDRQELLRIQQLLQSLVAKVSKPSSSRQSAFMAASSERPDHPEVAYHTSAVSADEADDYDSDGMCYSRPL